MKIILIASVFILLQSCSKPETPMEFFNKTALTLNRTASTIYTFGSKQIIALVESRKQKAMIGKVGDKYQPTDSHELHIKTMFIAQIAYHIKDIKPTDDKMELITASLNLFEFFKRKI